MVHVPAQPGMDHLENVHPVPNRPLRKSDRYYLENGGIHATIERFAHYARGRLLDIGCGDRPYAGYVRHRTTSYVGFDYPLNRYIRGRPDVAGSGMALPFRDGSFGTVLSTQVLEHVPEPLEFLREVRRVLQQDGHLILTAPQTWGRHEEPHDYYRYTSHGLRYLCRKAGFDLVEMVQRGGLWATVGQRIVGLIHPSLGGSKVAGAASHVLNGAFLALDRRFAWLGDTLGYSLVARPAAVAPTRSPTTDK